MATVHCEACGKHYNYEKHGCCPNCGAYNRPPRREVVNADGSVRRIGEEIKQPVCAPEFSGEDRESRREVQHLYYDNQFVRKMRDGLKEKMTGKKPRTMQQKKAARLGVIIVVICAVIANLAEEGFDLFERHRWSGSVPEIVESADSVTEERYYDLGEAFELDGLKVSVSAVSVDRKEVSVTVTGATDSMELPELYWQDDDGNMTLLLPRTVTELNGEGRQYQYDVSDYHEPDGSGYLLVIYNYGDEETVVNYVYLQ